MYLFVPVYVSPFPSFPHVLGGLDCYQETGYWFCICEGMVKHDGLGHLASKLLSGIIRVEYVFPRVDIRSYRLRHQI